jgi:hypothetical protein
MHVSRPVDVLRDAVTAIRDQLSELTRQSERTLLLGGVLLASALSAATAFVLAQYYSIDVFGSLTYIPEDCWLDWGTNVGRHCFADYAWIASTVSQPNPWIHLLPPGWPDLPYPAGALVPHLAFAYLGKLLGAPRLGLIAYEFCLTVAVLSPALWAARGARGLERVVVFVACGVAVIPAWVAVDRGNSSGFVVPIALVFLVALCRRRWGLATVMVILAALLKPQFALLGVALFAARQWRMGGFAVVGVVVSNVAAYLLWPRDFPANIAQSMHNALHYGNFNDEMSYGNVSFAKGLLFIADGVKAAGNAGKLPVGYLAGPRSLIGYVILVLVVVALVALGRRMPPVMGGIVLLATANLFPAVAWRYYLVFVIPVAALLVRDPAGPPGSGIFDGLGDRRRAIGLCVTLATALTIVPIVVGGQQIPVPFPIVTGDLGAPLGHTLVNNTTTMVVPLLWLIACVAVIVSYARRPAPEAETNTPSTAVSGEPTTAGAS